MERYRTSKSATQICNSRKPQAKQLYSWKASYYHPLKGDGEKRLLALVHASDNKTSERQNKKKLTSRTSVPHPNVVGINLFGNMLLTSMYLDHMK